MARRVAKRKQTAAQRAASLRNLAIGRKTAAFKLAARRNLMRARASPKFHAAVLRNLAKARASPKAAAARLRNLALARAAKAAKRASGGLSKSTVKRQRSTSASALIIHERRVLHRRETPAMRRLQRTMTAAFNRQQRLQAPKDFFPRRRSNR